MSKITTVQLIDDLDGTAADETIDFSFEGVAYTIDLNKANAERFRETFANWMAAATKVGRVGRKAAAATVTDAPVKPRRGAAAADRADRKAYLTRVREFYWKNADKYPDAQVSKNGKIKQELIDQYEKHVANLGA